MKIFFTKKDFLDLLKGRDFISEEELQKLVMESLPELLGVKTSQIEIESNTTSFDGTLSNRADILINTDSELPRVLVVIECKLHKSVAFYNDENYTEAVKQLHKYCQDVRAPYGIVLSDTFCAIYSYKYWRYNMLPERISEDKIPDLRKIENEIALRSLGEVVTHPKAEKYIYLGFLIIYAIGYSGNWVGKWIQNSGNTAILLLTVLFVVFSSIMFVVSLIRKG